MWPDEKISGWDEEIWEITGTYCIGKVFDSWEMFDTYMISTNK